MCTRLDIASRHYEVWLKTESDRNAALNTARRDGWEKVFRHAWKEGFRKGWEEGFIQGQEIGSIQVCELFLIDSKRLESS